jgi:hypothetical protein
MKQVLLLGLALLLLLPLASCGTSVDSAKEDFCSDLDAFRQSLAGLREIGLGSTKDDLQDAVKDTQDTWSDLKDSASKLEDVQLDAVEDAFGDLQDTVQDIPDDATLAEKLTEVKDAVVATVGEIEQIATTECNPAQQ